MHIHWFAISLLATRSYIPIIPHTGQHTFYHSPLLPLNFSTQVIRVAHIIDHVLVPDNKDNDIPGQFHACHAEKQLIAYFISKHVFLEPEIRAFKNPFRYPDTYDRGDDESEEGGGTLHELAAMAPPASLKQASILVSSPPCGDCMRFIRFVNAKLNLRISVRNTCVQD